MRIPKATASDIVRLVHCSLQAKLLQIKIDKFLVEELGLANEDELDELGIVDMFIDATQQSFDANLLINSLKAFKIDDVKE